MQRAVRVVSLNIQHGWNTRHMAPAFVSEKKVVKNLDRIVDLISLYDADVILLQEVDRTSPLTSKIDQLAYIQSKIGHQYSAFGASSELKRKDKLMYSAGCGIISRFPMNDVENVKFGLSFPTPRKGFLTATLSLPQGHELTVASVHLVSFDILKRKSRDMQIKQLTASLKSKPSFLIGGDMNGSGKSPHLKVLMEQLSAQAHDPRHEGKELRTFPSIRPTRRLDWILASPDLTFSDYRTFKERVSDHLAVGSTVHY